MSNNKDTLNYKYQIIKDTFLNNTNSIFHKTDENHMSFSTDAFIRSSNNKHLNMPKFSIINIGKGNINK